MYPFLQEQYSGKELFSKFSLLGEMRSSLLMSVVTSVITPAIKSKSCCFMSLLHYPPLMTASYRCFRARSRLSCCNSHADDDMRALFQVLFLFKFSVFLCVLVICIYILGIYK